MNSPIRIMFLVRRISTSGMCAAAADTKCPRPPECQPRPVKKQNLLVYDKSNPCYEKSKPSTLNYRLPIKTAQAKKIKVCTAADLKRMCTPKLCECPKKKRRRFGLGALLIFLAKVAVAGYLVYFTFDQGFWGRSSDTEQLYIRICKFIRKPSSDEMKKFRQSQSGGCRGAANSCDPFIARDHQLKVASFENSDITEEDLMRQRNWCQGVPNLSKMANCIKTCWNRMVLKSFAILTGDAFWREKKQVEVDVNPYCPAKENQENQG